MANPTTTFTWPEFDPAATYELALVSVGQDLNVNPGTEISSLVIAGAEQADAKDLFPAGQAAGSYNLQLRAEVDGFYTIWSSPQLVSWDNVLPGVPGPIDVGT